MFFLSKWNAPHFKDKYWYWNLHICNERKPVDSWAFFAAVLLLDSLKLLLLNNSSTWQDSFLLELPSSWASFAVMEACRKAVIDSGRTVMGQRMTQSKWEMFRSVNHYKRCSTEFRMQLFSSVFAYCHCLRPVYVSSSLSCCHAVGSVVLGLSSKQHFQKYRQRCSFVARFKSVFYILYCNVLFCSISS